MARIQDVAARAKVSKATVSYVFSPQKSALISPETRQKVLEAARELDYKPSFIAKALSKQRAYNVALVLPERSAQSMSVHLLHLFHGILQLAEKSEYVVSTFFGVNERFIARVEDRRFDGIIVIGLSSDRACLDKLAALKLPTVVLNREYPAAEHISCVCSDLKGWLLNESERLLSEGCRRILLLNKGLYTDAGKVLDAALSEAQKIFARYDNAFLECADTDRGSGVHGLLQKLFRKSRYDAVIINGASVSSAVLRSLPELNLVPGKDIKLSGFAHNAADMEAGLIWQHNLAELNRCAWQMLEKMFAGSPGEFKLLPLIAYTDPTADKAPLNGFDV